MKQIIVSAAIALLAGCAGLGDSDNAASGTTASDDTLPLWMQNPANCAEAGLYCRRR
jgi:hypothetical protein